jgi:hypothetical protein
MNVRNQFVACVALCLVAATSSLASAQGRGGGVPAAVPPPQNFDTSTEHYEYLKRLYNGGTVHTHASVPKWEGLWSSGGNNGQGNLFLEAGEIIEGVLTPPYEAAFQMRRRIMAEQGQQPYDRLTTCEPAGMPRWLVEPYVREWVNTPTQSWWLNDLANDTPHLVEHDLRSRPAPQPDDRRLDAHDRRSGPRRHLRIGRLPVGRVADPSPAPTGRP